MCICLQLYDWDPISFGLFIFGPDLLNYVMNILKLFKFAKSSQDTSLLWDWSLCKTNMRESEIIQWPCIVSNNLHSNKKKHIPTKCHEYTLPSFPFMFMNLDYAREVFKKLMWRWCLKKSLGTHDCKKICCFTVLCYLCHCCLWDQQS